MDSAALHVANIEGLSVGSPFSRNPQPARGSPWAIGTIERGDWPPGWAKKKVRESFSSLLAEQTTGIDD
jgi:hypothetical protein